MLSLPCGRVVVLSVAEPLISVTVPTVVPLLVKVMVPVGVATPFTVPDNLAVRVTDWPWTDGLGEVDRVICVAV